MKNFLIVNGPNLNLLGKRETSIYGELSLDQIKNHTEKMLSGRDLNLEWFQSNIEGEIVEKIQKTLDKGVDGIVINPAAYSHTSVAIYDALRMVSFPIVEVHLSNVYRREQFRQTMLTAQAASIIMSGLGKDAYFMGIIALLNKEDNK